MSKKKVLENARTEPVSFVVKGEPASKANSRRLVLMGGKPRFIKSKKALTYLTYFAAQAPRLDPLFLGDVCVTMTIYYASRRPDLDESLILDAMQGCIYRNDRQVRRKVIQWGLDRDNPRTEITIHLLESVPSDR